ncbi:hypothetical protein AA0473_1823 [Acetobacter orleanensis NRIC 0473]|nr:hypothetical protein AA0473_1823 [Acetobacter orleanensis NRIC 0473]
MALMGGFMPKQAVNPHLSDICIRVSELRRDCVPERVKRDFCWQTNAGLEQ